MAAGMFLFTVKLLVLFVATTRFTVLFYCSLCCADVSEHCGQTLVLLVLLQRTFMVQLDKFTF